MFLDVVCSDLGRASAHLEVVARQAKLAGDDRVIAKVLSSMDEARAALDRVYALLWTVGSASSPQPIKK